MPKVDKIPCPGCGEQTPVKKGKSGKPYIRCDDCGIDVFVRGAKGVNKFFGDDPPAADPPPRKKQAEKGGKDDWDW